MPCLARMLGALRSIAWRQRALVVVCASARRAPAAARPPGQVVRTFRPPEGAAPGEVDAAGDGEVLVVLDLVQGQDLLEAGLARELVNR